MRLVNLLLLHLIYQISNKQSNSIVQNFLFKSKTSQMKLFSSQVSALSQKKEKPAQDAEAVNNKFLKSN